MHVQQQTWQVDIALPDQLIRRSDWPPEQVVVLHGEVCDAPIKLGTLKYGKKVCRIIE